MLHVAAAVLLGAAHPGKAVRGGRLGEVANDQGFDGGFGLVAELEAVAAEHLDPVLVGGVVAGGDDDAQAVAQGARQVGDAGGGDHAHVIGRRAFGGQPGQQGVGDLLAAGARIAPDHHDRIGERLPQPAADRPPGRQHCFRRQGIGSSDAPDAVRSELNGTVHRFPHC